MLNGQSQINQTFLIVEIPRPQKTNTKLIVIICTLVGVIGLGLSLKFLYNRKTQMAKRRCASTVYRRTTRDDEEEGTPVD